ncbi:MAG: sporulation transcription factor Spo0A [Clostridiales bacterium]|nr:sporulation transcription factor Spo0A [Clostridiales bacterium]MBQ2768730.1 sporulation transcription factor Spo0A [Clostridia bacterium]
MKTNSVILLESNSAVLTQLKEAFDESKDFHVLYAGDDGDEGIKEILKLKPDLVIVGMFLKGTDGCGIIRTVKKTWAEAKIVATGVASDTLIERAMGEGAVYYLVKPFSLQTALERIRELVKTQSAVKEPSVAKRAPVTVEEKISEIFISIGIPPHIKGYGYLREGIKMTIERPYVINSVTKELYPSIAKKFQTTASKVERAIRHAIEVAWNRGRIDAINAIFGARIYLGNEKPTNSEFIALVADKLILENMG